MRYPGHQSLATKRSLPTSQRNKPTKKGEPNHGSFFGRANKPEKGNQSTTRKAKKRAYGERRARPQSPMASKAPIPIGDLSRQGLGAARAPFVCLDIVWGSNSIWVSLSLFACFSRDTQKTEARVQPKQNDRPISRWARPTTRPKSSRHPQTEVDRNIAPSRAPKARLDCRMFTTSLGPQLAANCSIEPGQPVGSMYPFTWDQATSMLT